MSKSKEEEVEYELDLERVKELIKKLDVKRALLQMPDGLKAWSSLVIDELERIGVEVVLDAGHTWGICDIPLYKAKLIHADAIIHYGHLDINGYFKIDNIKVISVPAYYKREISVDVLNELVNVLKPFKAIGLSSSIQHVKELFRVGKYLKDRGFNVYIGRSKLSLFRPGQITGCELGATLSINDYVDAHVCISGGIFHAIGIAIMTGKDTFSLDPYKGVVESSRVREFLKKVLVKKLYNLTIAMEANIFGIIVSRKPGQYKLALALKAKRELEKRGRKAIVIISDEVSPTAIANIRGVDVFVNTACPRLAIDELEYFEGIIMINLNELKYVISNNMEGYTLRDALSWNMNLNFIDMK